MLKKTFANNTTSEGLIVQDLAFSIKKPIYLKTDTEFFFTFDLVFFYIFFNMMCSGVNSKSCVAL